MRGGARSRLDEDGHFAPPHPQRPCTGQHIESERNPEAVIAQDRARFTNKSGLVTDFVARFTGNVGLIAEFRPLPEGEERPPGGLCA